MAVGTRTEVGKSFTSSGNNFVFSDNPEELNLEETSLFYLWGASVGTSYKDVEMYHHCNNGWNNNASFRFGVAVQNTTGSAITITYKCVGNALNETSSNDNAAMAITTNTLASFMATTQYTTLTVPAHSVAILNGVTASFTQGYRKFISYRGQLKASVNSGVYFRVYVAGARKMSSIASELFNIGAVETASGTQFCGELGYTQKNTTLDASDTTKVYRLFTHFPNNPEKVLNGPTEYSPVVSYKTGGQAATKLEGNFGVVYHLTLTNAANRKIWIEPEWSMIVDNEGNTRSAATILYRFNGGTWVPRDTPLSPGQAYYFAIPAVNGSATIDVVLPGGNCGNYLVYFD